MWSKIYLGVLTVAVVITTFFTYYSWSWLQSIGLPDDAVAGYEYHAALAWTATWIFAIVLLLLGNVIFWTRVSSWALWTTFLYFSAFVVIRLFWLDQSSLSFKKLNGLAANSFTLGPILAVILVILMGVIVFFDIYLVTRLRAKTYPPADPTAVEPEASAE